MIFKVNIKNPEPERIVFIDRDGVLIEDEGYLTDPDEITPIAGSRRSLEKLREKGFSMFLVSNQAGLAKGIIEEKKFHEIRRRFEEIFDPEGKIFDGIFYCPHHPEGKIPELSRRCTCRKPGPHMIETAMGFLNRTPPTSNIFLIGDKVTDIALGKVRSFRTFLVLTGHGYKEREKMKVPLLLPDYITDNFDEAVTILSGRL